VALLRAIPPEGRGVFALNLPWSVGRQFATAIMARPILLGLVVTYAIAVVQSTIASGLAVLGVAPDLLLLWTVCLGLLRGPALGVLSGWLCGLLQGALEQSWIGAYAISKTVSGFLAGHLGARMFKENWLVPALCAALLTLANETCFLILAHSGQLWSEAGRVIAVRVVYHAVLAPFAFAGVDRVHRALTRPRWEPE